MTERQKLMSSLRKLDKEARDLRKRQVLIAREPTMTDELMAESATGQDRLIAIADEGATIQAGIDALPGDIVAGDPATREHSALAIRARATAMVTIAAMMDGHKSAHGDGALAEFQQEAGLAENFYPVEFLRRGPSYAQLEAAAGLTSAPTNVGTDEATVETPVFSDGDAGFLGVAQPIVDGGDQVFPDISTRPTVGGPHDDASDVAETALTVNSELLAPRRGQASVTGLTSQLLRMPALEAGIVETLRGGLAEWYDGQCVAELLTVTQDAAAATEETFATYMSRLIFGNVDGRFSREEFDLRLLVGTATLTHMAGKYKSAETDVSALGGARVSSGGVRASVHIPAVAGNKQDVLIAKGIGRRNAVCPIWRGVEITTDRITGAGKGQVEVFAAMFAAFSVSRAAGFARVEVRHAV